MKTEIEKIRSLLVDAQNLIDAVQEDLEATNMPNSANDLRMAGTLISEVWPELRKN